MSIPMPKPGIYWVKFKPWEGCPTDVSVWEIAQFPATLYGQDSPPAWLTIGSELDVEHSDILEIGPRIEEPKP